MLAPTTSENETAPDGTAIPAEGLTNKEVAPLPNGSTEL